MSEIVERVAAAIAAKLDDTYSSSIPAGQLQQVAEAAIAAITSNAEACGVCGCAVYKGLPTKVS
jgi:hypothetical protein